MGTSPVAGSVKGIGEFRCTVPGCNKVFKYKTSLNGHRRKHHGNSEDTVGLVKRLQAKIAILEKRIERLVLDAYEKHVPAPVPHPRGTLTAAQMQQALKLMDYAKRIYTVTDQDAQLLKV